jgi:hypothetical protein
LKPGGRIDSCASTAAEMPAAAITPAMESRLTARIGHDILFDHALRHFVHARRQEIKQAAKEKQQNQQYDNKSWHGIPGFDSTVQALLPDHGTQCIAPLVEKLSERLDRPIVLVGLMGAGKSTVGRRLAKRLGLPFVDSDSAIEDASGFSAAEVYERYGERDFRDGERRLVARLIDGSVGVIATGGGASPPHRRPKGHPRAFGQRAPGFLCGGAYPRAQQPRRAQ